MSWYDVYDNVEIRLITRKRAATVTALAVVVCVFSVLCVLVGLTGRLPFVPAAVTGLVVSGVFARWLVRRIRRLRRIVWCVKLSSEEVVGYDYARRRPTIPWRTVERIEIGDAALTIVGPAPIQLEIAHVFRDFVQVSHRVVHYADRYGIPVFVNGKPWQHINVYDVFPFLADDAGSPRRGSAAM